VEGRTHFLAQNQHLAIGFTIFVSRSQAFPALGKPAKVVILLGWFRRESLALVCRILFEGRCRGRRLHPKGIELG